MEDETDWVAIVEGVANISEDEEIPDDLELGHAWVIIVALTKYITSLSTQLDIITEERIHEEGHYDQWRPN